MIKTWKSPALQRTEHRLLLSGQTQPTPTTKHQMQNLLDRMDGLRRSSFSRFVFLRSLVLVYWVGGLYCFYFLIVSGVQGSAAVLLLFFAIMSILAGVGFNFKVLHRRLRYDQLEQ
jgi:hypothetical protein